MWPVLFTALRTYAPYVTFPVAFVVGAVGYHLEWFVRGTPKAREEISILERREDRKLEEQAGMDGTQDLYQRTGPICSNDPKQLLQGSNQRTGLTMAHRLRSGHHCGNGSARLLGKQGDVQSHILSGRAGDSAVSAVGTMEPPACLKGTTSAIEPLDTECSNAEGPPLFPCDPHHGGFTTRLRKCISSDSDKVRKCRQTGSRSRKR
ncbi:Small integral membrane protein 12 [Takifugu flavidus]|uniref:Small integral membrane protein 12 n=1 Tax=Takifugu flavidus TaxID=433684 RepID=A0A5C6NEP0_9TELE|nr:Small integral membrane protein 12 [Takifugu flavidus]